MGFPGGSVVKNLPANAGDVRLILGREDRLEEGMATQSTIFVCNVLWTREPSPIVHGVPKSWTKRLEQAQSLYGHLSELERNTCPNVLFSPFIKDMWTYPKCMIILSLRSNTVK